MNAVSHFKSGLLFASLFFASCFSQATFLPENQIRYDALSTGAAQITQPEFNERIAQIQKAFEPNVARFGGKFSLEGNWANEKIVAQASQMFGTWRIQFSGGLARRPELSADGMTLIICHEVGHLVGGFAFGGGSPFGGATMSDEGQADYFSTHVCAKKLWIAEGLKNAAFREKVKPYAKEKCDAVYVNAIDQDICYRSTVGVESVMATMASLKKEPESQFETPDTKVVEKTDHAHPATQCRLDTTFQGALCAAYFDELIIPGKSSRGGASGLEAEREAALHSCTEASGFATGRRPACWFKARM